MSAPTPPLVPQPFATAAGPSFINVIPNTTADPQAASYQDGFPEQTFQPVASGGLPPLGQDFNGILNAITKHLFALQGGQLQTYRVDVSGAITGYKLGALLAMTDGAGYWINRVDGNTTDPDAGGANWEPVYAYGSTPKAVTGGLLTLTAPESSRGFLVFTGTLIGNQQVVVPNSFRHWLVINGCVMGGFTLTVKTAAGSGVAIPAGGAAAPTAIYCDSVNVNLVFSPSPLPTSVAPVADTILLRNNLGQAFGLTAPLNTRTTELATTAFANPNGSLAANGWRQNADGSIEQWGFNTRFGSAIQTVNFPTAFPTACFNVVCSRRNASGNEVGQAPAVVGVPGLNSFQIAHADNSNGAYWRAIGN
jgi:hypothetical protein